MSDTLSSIVQPERTNSQGGPLRISNASTDGIARYLGRRAAIAELRELDDRALGDIGLSRFQIEAAVYGVVTASSLRGA